MRKFNITIMTREQLRFHEFLESDVLLSIGHVDKDPVILTTMPVYQRVLRLPSPLVNRNYDYIAKFFKRNVDSTNIIVHSDEELIHPEILVNAIHTYFGISDSFKDSSKFLNKLPEAIENIDEPPASYSIYKALVKQFD